MPDLSWVVSLVLPVAVLAGMTVRFVRARKDRRARWEGVRVALSAADEVQGVVLGRPEPTSVHADPSTPTHWGLVLDAPPEEADPTVAPPDRRPGGV